MDGVSWLRSVFTALPTFSANIAADVQPIVRIAADSASEISGSPLALDIFLVVALILINGFFAGSEMAIVTLNDNYVNKQAESGHKTYIKIKRLTDNPGNFLSTIQTGVTFAGFLSSAFAGERFSSRITMGLDPSGNLPWLSTLSLVVVTFITSYLSLIIGELVPKQLALHNPEKFSALAVAPVTYFGRLMKPFTAFLNISTNLVLKMLGIPSQREAKSVTEEEIRMMVDVSTEGGNIEASEKAMITNIFELNDKEVSEIMTHRMNVAALEVNTNFEQAVAMAMSEGYTRFPVYEEHIDNIIGILNVKDLMRFYADKDNDKFNLRSLLRAAYFTPETKHVDALFREMQLQHVSIAIVIDEYGGVSGIISMEDLVEEIVGNIQDEFDEEQTEIVMNNDGSYTIDGLCELYNLEQTISEFNIPEEDEIDYDTIAGLVLHQLDRIPDEDERPEVWFKNYKFKVLAMDDRRIATVQMWIYPPLEESTDNENSGDNRNYFNRNDRNGESELNDEIADEDYDSESDNDIEERELRTRQSLPIIQKAVSHNGAESAGMDILSTNLNVDSGQPKRGHSFINQQN